MKPILPVPEPTEDLISAQIALNNYKEFYECFKAFAQSTSNFELDKFIVLSENTPSACYVAVLRRTHELASEIIIQCVDAIEHSRVFTHRWINNDNDIPISIDGKLHWYDLDAIVHQHLIMEKTITINDKMSQLTYLNRVMGKLCKNHKKGFTKEDHEREMPQYWNTKLIKQVYRDLVASAYKIHDTTILDILHASANSIIDTDNELAIEFPDIFASLSDGDVTNVISCLQVFLKHQLELINQTSDAKTNKKQFL